MVDHVRTKAVTGEYVGKVLPSGVHEYLGVRYANPPQRWKRATPLAPSDTLISALEDRPAPWQTYMPEEFDCEPPMSEDCLYLNIWTSGQGTKKPVYVFIHGGSYVEGSIRTDCYGGIYCGDEFVAAHPDVVYVNIEYRFGPFGSMDLSAWDTDGEYLDSNNLQVLDQMAALTWIQENIAAFGGDPDHVTIGGQSAGSYSVFTLMAIPEAAKLFCGAICESSAPTSGPIRTTKAPQDARRTGKMMADFLGAKSLDDMLAATPLQLVAGTEALFMEPGYAGYNPCRDDKVIPMDIESSLASGCAKHVAVMSGTLAGEYSTDMLGMSAQEIEARVRSRFPMVSDEDIQAFKGNYPERSDVETMEDMYNDLGMRLRQISTSEAVLRGGSKVYMYYMPFKPEGARIRSQHCAELLYVSGKPDAGLYLFMNSGEKLAGEHPDYEFGKKIQDVWYNFIVNGDPNGSSLGIEWPLYDEENQKTAIFDREFSVEDGARRLDIDVIRHYQQ